jgi:hypothetical protein
MHGFWGVFWLAVILKIPIVALLGLVWWAVRNPPVPEVEREDGGGGAKHGPHPRRRPPQPPRRGPHGAPAPTPPSRVRAGASPASRGGRIR